MVRTALLKAYLRYIASTRKPIVMGPYRSELGFEVLYLIPFLHWALKYAGISPDRCIALSRGGMGVFYPAATNVDLYTLRGVDTVRLENQIDLEQRKIQKQTTVTDWDYQAAKDAVRSLGITGRYHLLHPSWMYRVLTPFWAERSGLNLVSRYCRFEPLPVPTLPEGFALPDKFVAVRFYERHTLPFSPDVRDMVTELVQNLASHIPVVLLNQQGYYDDHSDLPIAGPNIYTLPQVPPEQNFVLQAAVLARCQAFVGTYGGVAQWALRYRKPTLSAYVQFGGTAMAHRTLSHALAAGAKVPFECVDLRVLNLYRVALTRKVQQVAAA